MVVDEVISELKSIFPSHKFTFKKLKKDRYDILVEGNSTPVLKMTTHRSQYPIFLNFDGEMVYESKNQRDMAHKVNAFFNIPQVKKVIELM